MARLTHLTDTGEASMVDVSAKPIQLREAIASGEIQLQSTTLDLIERNEISKGNVLATARLAGIMAAKKTGDLIPLCHPLAITNVKVDFAFSEIPPGIHVKAEVKVSGQTGVEMEALTAVSVACLTLYDMLKAIDRGMVIGPIQLLEKRGGKSGTYRRRSRS